MRAVRGWSEDDKEVTPIRINTIHFCFQYSQVSLPFLNLVSTHECPKE